MEKYIDQLKHRISREKAKIDDAVILLDKIAKGTDEEDKGMYLRKIIPREMMVIDRLYSEQQVSHNVKFLYRKIVDILQGRKEEYGNGDDKDTLQ